MAEPLHTIRFKSGGMEFELTSTADEVAKAREALEPLLLAGLDAGVAEELEGGESGGVPGSQSAGKRAVRRAPRRRRREAAAGTGDERAEIREKLLGAPIEGFP